MISLYSSTDFAQLQRARIRRAQKAYRVRKEAHVSAIVKKCQDLEKVVDEMMSEFVGFSDVLMRKLDIDREAVGPLLRDTIERFLELGKRAAKEPGEDNLIETAEDEEHGGSGMTQGKQRMPVRGSEDEQPGSESIDVEQNISPVWSNFVPTLPLPESKPRNLADATPNPMDWATFDPYINNLWQPPSTSPLATSVIPYILAGRDSFASRLYFETISIATRSLSGDLPWDFAQSMFRFKLRYASRPMLFRVLASVLDMLLQGTTRIVSGGKLADYGDVDVDCHVKDSIVTELERGGRKEKDFLSTWQVERYLKERWALEVDSQAVRVQSQGNVIVFAPTFVPGFVEKAQVILNTGTLLDRLRAVSVTIGEGPRWHLTDIDSIVQTFLQENSVGHLATTI